MQDFQPIPGLSGRIFPGSDPATRRLRNYPSSTQQQQQPQSPIKCPRCDSANTKFCYYNNYNLSQPRHFCKSCRRYWTKGGVLRNVPVGGGCRKNSSKRSTSNKSKPDKDSRRRRRRRSPKPPSAASGSSSESSSTLTASNPNPNLNPHPVLEQPIFNPETTAGSSFAGLMAGAGAAEGFNFSDPGPLPGFDPKKKLDSGAVQQQAVDLQLQGKEGLNGLDWVGGGSVVDSGSLFDITSTVNAAEYWNQTHWGGSGTDPSLYLP